MITRLALFFFWLIHFSPRPVLSFAGKLIGISFMLISRERNLVVKKNLSACFPNHTERQIKNLVKKHFIALGSALAHTGVAWWGSLSQVKDLAEIKGWENFEKADQNNPVIVLAPHFVAVEILGIRISIEKDAVVVYSHQKDKTFDDFLKKKRARFSEPKLFSRQEGLKGVIRALKARVPLFLLPDMDFGPQDSIFVPFFGVTCATTTAPPRIAHLANATIVPVVIKKKPNTYGYQITFLPAWKNFPTNIIENDINWMNKFIENEVKKTPEQYYWVHKRFKTRPVDESPFY